MLIDGVPLYPTVGLAHPHLMPRRAAAGTPPTPAPTPGDPCAGVTSICGRYERIDPEQIVFSFKMPTGYVGTPTMTLIAPGKSVDLNSIRKLRINGSSNLNLKNDAAYLFGSRPGLSIGELQLLDDPSTQTYVKALLTGGRFDDAKDRVFVNGQLLVGPERIFRSRGLYELQFTLPASENLKITVVRDDDVASKSFTNPAALKITSAGVLSYTPAAKKQPAFMLVKIEGTGFSTRLRPIAGAERWQLVSVAPREMVVRFTNPGPTVAVTLIDIVIRGSASTSVQRPAAEKKDEGKKADGKERKD